MPRAGLLPGLPEPPAEPFRTAVGEAALRRLAGESGLNDNRPAPCEMLETYGRLSAIDAFPDGIEPQLASPSDATPPLDGAPDAPTGCPVPKPARTLSLASAGSFLAHIAVAAVLLASAPALVMPAPEEEGATVVDVIMIGDNAETDEVAAVVEAPPPEPVPEPTPAPPVVTEAIPEPTLEPKLDIPVPPPTPPLLAAAPVTPAPERVTPPPPPPPKPPVAKPVELEKPKPPEPKPEPKPEPPKKAKVNKPAEKPKKPVAQTPAKKTKKTKAKVAAEAKPAKGSVERRKGAAHGKAEAGSQQAGKARASGSAEGSAAVANYPGKVQKRLRRVLKVPSEFRKGGATGLRITLTLSRSGAVQSAAIARSSGNPALDQKMLAAARAAGPFPPFPEGYAKASWTFAQDVKIGGRG